MTLAFTQATTDDIATLQDLARRIWHAHYPGIISPAQIDYMLDRFFGEATLRQDLAAGTRWELARLGPAAVGFLSCVAEPAQRRMKLSKLYLVPELHGRGLGQAMLERARALAAESGALEIHLNVNKRNAKAIRAYQRAGFATTEAVVVDIGGGFVLDDYLMTLKLS